MRNRTFEGREDYPRLVEIADNMRQSGCTDTEIRRRLLAESGVARSTLHHAEQRGSIPALPPKDKARAHARRTGETKYFGRPCETHGDVGRWTADGKCCQCDLNYLQDWKNEKRSQDQ